MRTRRVDDDYQNKNDAKPWISIDDDDDNMGTSVILKTDMHTHRKKENTGLVFLLRAKVTLCLE